MQLVDLGGEDEVALGETVDFVCPNGDLGLSPGEDNVRVMALFFGDRAYFVHEFERGLEIGEGERASNVVLVDDMPIGQLMAEVVELLAVQGWNASLAGDASFGS